MLFYLWAMVSEAQIQQLVREIVEGYQPEKIYLFGSYANGIANEDSDIDLFIVKNTSARKKDRVEQVLHSLKNYPSTGVDFIIYTPQEVELTKNYITNIAQEAIKTGRLMYERF
jgi:predicted nucleotidyltransferase